MTRQVVRALVPHADWEQHAGRRPQVEGVRFEVDVWAAPDPLPAGAAAEFYVPWFEDRSAAADAIGRIEGVEVVQLLSAGYDWIADSVPAGVTLCNAGDVHSPAVAEWVLAVLLAHVRELPDFAAAAAQGQWAPHDTATLDGAEVVLLGYGSIGRALEAALEPLGVVVHGVGRARLGELPDLLPRATALVVLTPLSEATRHQVDAAMLGRLPDGAVVVNAARGPVVDDGALRAELRTGRLRAALDVTDPEPLPAGDPLFTMPGVILTPHVAGSVSTFLPRAYGFVVVQLERFARGEPLAAVVRGD